MISNLAPSWKPNEIRRGPTGDDGMISYPCTSISSESNHAGMLQENFCFPFWEYRKKRSETYTKMRIRPRKSPWNQKWIIWQYSFSVPIPRIHSHIYSTRPACVVICVVCINDGERMCKKKRAETSAHMKIQWRALTGLTSRKTVPGFLAWFCSTLCGGCKNPILNYSPWYL